MLTQDIQTLLLLAILIVGPVIARSHRNARDGRETACTHTAR